MYYHYGKWDRGCPLLRGNKCTITMGSGTEVVLFSEVTNVLSLWEGITTCLYRVSTVTRLYTRPPLLAPPSTLTYHVRTQLDALSSNSFRLINPLPNDFSFLILKKISICFFSSRERLLQNSMSMSWAGTCRISCFCRYRSPGVPLMGALLEGKASKYALVCNTIQ